MPFPDDDSYTPTKAQLGAQLFADASLSHDGRIACISCHMPSRGWSDGGAHRVVLSAGRGPVRVPTILNAAWSDTFGGEGSVDSLEAFTFVPLQNPAIMGPADAHSIQAMTRRLAAEPLYASLFAQAFPGRPISPDTVSQAIATFERTVISAPAPFDRWAAGQPDAIDGAARRGFLLFSGRAGCTQCHSGWTFTDGSFHDIGVGDALGRGALFPSSVKLQHAFKVPTLRDVALRAPFMHDGSLPDLASVVAFYDHGGGIDRPSRSNLIHPLGLSDQDKSDLVAFLRSLTSGGGPGHPPLASTPAFAISAP